MVSDDDCCVTGPRFNLGEDRDACKCIVTAQHEDTLNIRQATSSFVRLVEGERGGKPLITFQFLLPQIWVGTELNRIVTCMVHKATANDRHNVLPFYHDEFRGPRSGTSDFLYFRSKYLFLEKKLLLLPKKIPTFYSHRGTSA
ncbi:uncharacterized protein TNCV_1465161 [Trichonephila clavipes]|nr:uncharacterized protein TNCV_1465161 [Trichonephila clavipes]